MVSFAVQKLLSFIRSHLFIFVFVSLALGDGSKKGIYEIVIMDKPNYFIKDIHIHKLSDFFEDGNIYYM